MEYEQIIRKVQEYAGGISEDEARLAAAVTLETLGGRLSRIHRQHLAAQVPRELKAAVLARKRREIFSLSDFYIRVGARANITFHQALRWARAVMRALMEQVSSGEMSDIFSELTEDWAELYSGPAATISAHTVDTHDLYAD